MTALNALSALRSNAVRSFSGRWRISLAHIIGTSVSGHPAAEMTMVTASVMANFVETAGRPRRP